MMRDGTVLTIGRAVAVQSRPRRRRSAVDCLDLPLVVVTTTTFALLVYVICIVLGLIFPSSVMWVTSLTGFDWTIGGALLGLVQVGWYVALGSAAYVWLYNMFAELITTRRRHT